MRIPKGTKDGCTGDKCRWLLGDDDICLVERKAPLLDGTPMTKRGNVMFEASKAPTKGQIDGKNLVHSCHR